MSTLEHLKKKIRENAETEIKNSNKNKDDTITKLEKRVKDLEDQMKTLKSTTAMKK